MSMLSHAEQAGRRSLDALLEGRAESEPGTYLTDGHGLYRLLGAVTVGAGWIVGVENCRSLDVVFVSADDLRDRRLRSVPACALAA